MLFLLYVVAIAQLAQASSKANTPSFVILFADDMGYSQPSRMSDLSGFAGDNGTISTPNLDRFAAEGVTFTSWYSAFHVCSPSRFAMMTGRLSVRGGIGYVGSGSNGVLTAEAVGGLPQNETTMAEILRKGGYTTGAVGKWHLGQTPDHLPTQHGFDFYYGIPFSCDMGISAWKYSNHSEPPFQVTPLPLLHNNEIIEQPVNLGNLTQRYVNSALEFMRNASDHSKPFFLYLPFNHIHAPNFASRKFCGSSKRGQVGDATQELDEAIGQIMKGAEDYGIDDNIVWFFTSDNGAPLSNDNSGNGPLRDGKTTTWEGGVREPAAVRWKGTIKPSRTDAIVGTYDIFPTVLSLAGLAPPSELVIDGLDLSPILFPSAHLHASSTRGISGSHNGHNGSSPSLGHRCVFHYSSPQYATIKHNGMGAVRCGSYKAHYYTTSSTHNPIPDGAHDPPVIYDLSSDIGEYYPLKTTTTAYKQALAEIDEALATHLASVESVPCQMIAEQACKGTTAPVCVGGDDGNLAVCKDPHSKQTLPQWPNCTSDPVNFGTSQCRSDSKECIAKCTPL